MFLLYDAWDEKCDVSDHSQSREVGGMLELHRITNNKWLAGGCELLGRVLCANQVTGSMVGTRCEVRVLRIWLAGGCERLARLSGGNRRDGRHRRRRVCDAGCLSSARLCRSGRRVAPGCHFECGQDG